MKKLPKSLHWWPFYYHDFFEDESVKLMTNEQIGCYVRLLTHQWVEGSIPADTKRLAKICHVTRQRWASIRDGILVCYIKKGLTRLVQKKLASIRKNQLKKLAVLSEAGRKGGKATVSKRLTPKPASRQVKARLNHTETDTEQRQSRPETRRNDCLVGVIPTEQQLRLLVLVGQEFEGLKEPVKSDVERFLTQERLTQAEFTEFRTMIARSAKVFGNPEGHFCNSFRGFIEERGM